MFHFLKTLFLFLSQRYLNKVTEQDRHINIHFVQDMISLARQWFPIYGKTHWKNLPHLLSDFKSDYPFSIKEDFLPKGLLGVFIPIKKDKKKGQIILNKVNSPKMHLSTIAHENGHMLAHLLREQRGITQSLKLRPLYARSEELTRCLEDPEELLADYIGAIGAYPLDSFKKNFCDSNGKVKSIYQKYPFLLVLRAAFYVTRYYPELTWNFFFSESKMYHLCLTIHFIRLRTFIFTKYGI